MVSVPPIYNSGQAANSGYWVYDYAAMGAVVDRIRIMTYAFSTDSAGPIAPINWVRTSLDAAVAAAPASKIVLGIPAYGTDWVTGIVGSCPVGTNLGRKSFGAKSAAGFAFGKGAVPRWDPATQERTFSYVDTFAGKDANGFDVRCNVTRTAWYVDPDATHLRVALAQNRGIVGVALWALGNDDPLSWQGIAAARSGQSWTAPALPVPPTPPAPPAPIYSPPPLPSRYLDTRPGYATVDGQFAGIGRRAAGSLTELKIAERGAVPGSATAVSLNLTVIGEGDGYVTVWPCGPRPGTSNVNVRNGQVVANAVVTKLSATGTVCLFSQNPSQLIVDVINVLPSSGFVALPAPARLADSRLGHPTVDGLGAGTGIVPAGGVLEVDVVGRASLTPSAAVALNITVNQPVGGGYLSVSDCDLTRPATSNVNFVAGQTVANSVLTALSPTGSVCIFASEATHVIVDAFGTFTPQAYLALVPPARLADTRPFHLTVDRKFSGAGIRAAGSVLELQVGGRGGLVSTPKVAALNITAVGSTTAGYVTTFPCGTARPNVSSLNYAKGQTVPNLVLAPLSADGRLCIYVSSQTHLVVDAFGALTP